MAVHFDLPAGAALRIHTSSGDVTIIAEDRRDLEVDAKGRSVHLNLDEDGRTARLRSPRLGSTDLIIRCPTGVDVSVGTISGDVRLEGTLGSVKVASVSGDIEVGTASEVDIRSVSGDLSVTACRSRCQLNTKSGDIRVGAVDGPARASTISGEVRLATSGGGGIEVKTVSGGVTISVPQGKQPRTRLHSLSGRVACHCPQGSDFDLEASTLSGHIQVEPR